MTSPAPHPDPHQPSTWDDAHDHAHGHSHAPEKKESLVKLTDRGKETLKKVKHYWAIVLAVLTIWWVGVGIGKLTSGKDEKVSLKNLEELIEGAEKGDTLLWGVFQSLWDKLAEQVDEYGKFQEIEGLETETKVKYMVMVDYSGDKKYITLRRIDKNKLTDHQKSVQGMRNLHEIEFSQYGDYDSTVTIEHFPSGEVPSDSQHESRVHSVEELMTVMKELKYKE